MTNDGLAGEEFRVQPRGGLDAAEVRRLSRLNPLYATLSVAQSWGLVAASVAVAMRWPHPLVWLAALLGITAGQHGLAVLAHEAAHYRLYETRPLNDLIGKLCGAPLGISMVTYRIIHRIHHNHLYEPIDPDLALMAGYPRGRAYLVKKLLKDLTGITTVKNYLYFNGRAVVKPIGDTSSSLRAAARRDRRLVLATQLVLLGAAVASGLWRGYLGLWLLPLVTLLQMVLRLRAVCEHGAVPGQQVGYSPVSPLTAARTTLAPRWVSWLLFPHHVSYHIEHHLHPSVPHYRLAECHRRLRDTGALNGAEVMPSLRRTLAKIFAPPIG